jgi:hypothetical protein
MGAIIRRNEDDDPPVSAVPTFLWPTKTQNIPKRITNGEPAFISGKLLPGVHYRPSRLALSSSVQPESSILQPDNGLGVDCHR